MSTATDPYTATPGTVIDTIETPYPGVVIEKVLAGHAYARTGYARKGRGTPRYSWVTRWNGRVVSNGTGRKRDAVELLPELAAEFGWEA